MFVILFEENAKKIVQFLGTNISRIAKAISFNLIYEWSSIYIRQKNIKWVEIGLVVLEAKKAEISEFMVPVNYPFVCHMAFILLATDTQPCDCLDIAGQLWNKVHI